MPCELANLAKGSHFMLLSENRNSFKKWKKRENGHASFLLQVTNEPRHGSDGLVGQDKARPSPCTCFVLAEAWRPLGTNCAARVPLPGGPSWRLLEYNSQLLLQKHLCFLVLLIFFTHMCMHTHRHKAQLCSFKSPGVPRRFIAFHALALEGFRNSRVFIYGLDWQSAPCKCSGSSSIELGALTPRSWSYRARGTCPLMFWVQALKLRIWLKCLGTGVLNITWK